MRPLELVLAVAEVTAWVVAAAGLRHATLAAGAALAVAALQAAVEGARWQLVPAYGCAAALIAAVALGARDAGPRAFAAVGVVALCGAVALPLAVPVFRLPTPSGPHAIGSSTRWWSDAARADGFTGAARRELMVQLWYPAADRPEAPRVPYVPDASVFGPLLDLLGAPHFLLDHLALVRTHAVDGAPPAPGRFPVVVFLSGRGGFRQSNTALVEELVSHGYLVAALDLPSASCGVVFPDGRRVAMDPRLYDPARPGHPAFLDEAVPLLAADVAFALDRLDALDRDDPEHLLTGQLDGSRAGIVGVSLGGIVAAQACADDARLRACIVLDAFAPADVVQRGLHQPALWLSRDADTMRAEGWHEADVAETQASMRAVTAGLGDAGELLLLPGAYHLDFTDAPRYSPLLRWFGLTGPIPPPQAHALVSTSVRGWLDRWLR
ncbi:MAG: carboxylic ester hydrolase [Myxococcota bacterium]